MKFQAANAHGAINNSWKIAGLKLSETIFAPHFKIPAHIHTNPCFFTVVEGGFTETYKTKSIECLPFSLMFQPPGEVHSDAVGSAAARCFIIEVGSEWTERMPLLTSPVKFDNGELARLAIKIRRELRETDDVTALAVEGLMLEMLAEAFREQAVKNSGQKPPRWLKQAKELLHERFSETLTLSEIAAAVGVHPVYLANEFRRCFNCSVGEYVRQLRVSYACREIFETDAPLVEIAVAAGFYDQSHFSRTFKKITGVTPAQYRNKRRVS